MSDTDGKVIDLMAALKASLAAHQPPKCDEKYDAPSAASLSADLVLDVNSFAGYEMRAPGFEPGRVSSRDPKSDDQVVVSAATPPAPPETIRKGHQPEGNSGKVRREVRRDPKNCVQAERSKHVIDEFKLEHERAKTLKCQGCGWRAPKGLELLGKEAVAHMIHAHHVVPIACGGADERSNLVLVCPTCHAIAHALGYMEYVGNGERHIWIGPRTPEHLVFELRLIRKPREWALYVAAHRPYAQLMMDEQQRAEIAAGLRRPEVIRGGGAR